MRVTSCMLTTMKAGKSSTWETKSDEELSSIDTVLDHLNLPDGLHAKLRVFQHFNLRQTMKLQKTMILARLLDAIAG